MKPLQTCALDRVATGICTIVHSNRHKTHRSDLTVCIGPGDDKQCQKSQTIINLEVYIVLVPSKHNTCNDQMLYYNGLYLEVTYVAMVLKCTDN